MTYPPTLEDGFDEDDDNFEDEVLARVQKLAEDNPIPPDLKEQIGNWIKPQTMHTETDHADVMDAIAIAYPLIRDWFGERPEGDMTL